MSCGFRDNVAVFRTEWWKLLMTDSFRTLCVSENLWDIVPEKLCEPLELSLVFFPFPIQSVRYFHRIDGDDNLQVKNKNI